MRMPLHQAVIGSEHDVVAVRQGAREIARLLGFDGIGQVRVATVASELARNTLAYAGGGAVEFAVEDVQAGQCLLVEFSDQGPGIADPDAILQGRYRSPTGMGMGLLGARRVMDHFELDTAPGRGTRVRVGKLLPPHRVLHPAEAERLRAALLGREPRSLFEEVQRQNRELLDALAQLRERQEELLQLNRELEDTNRGVVALYAELDERVEQLRRSNALRAQFTSYLSHEFRTPLDSMLALSGLLLNRVDGELTEEQERQVTYLRRSARDLLDLVDDMLDTARMEAGQVTVRVEEFTVTELFSALRATLRPLTAAGSVALHFQDPAGLPPLRTDPAKLSQILRNFISNALKFTEQGEVQVEIAEPERGRIAFTVRDTGPGIAAEDQEWIFEDFTRVEAAGQRPVKGTGLGLPLSRKLARLLGGEVTVRSEVGAGAAFTVAVPRVHPGEDAGAHEPEAAAG